MAKPVAELDEVARLIAERTDYTFRDTTLLGRALTHASAAGGSTANYERLEFLGDRVLGLIVANFLFSDFPDADEGELSRRFNALVNAETCADVADELGLHEFIVAGAELKSLRGRKQLNVRADVAESLIAAIHLDGGFSAAETFVERFWRPRAKLADAGRRDAKTELQEWAHRQSAALPFYEVRQRTGPDHDPLFVVAVTIPGHEPAEGAGRSKREAEQAAATSILFREGVWQQAVEP